MRTLNAKSTACNKTHGLLCLSKQDILGLKMAVCMDVMSLTNKIEGFLIFNLYCIKQIMASFVILLFYPVMHLWVVPNNLSHGKISHKSSHGLLLYLKYKTLKVRQDYMLYTIDHIDLIKFCRNYLLIIC